MVEANAVSEGSPADVRYAEGSSLEKARVAM